MVHYDSQFQSFIDEFSNLTQLQLDPQNRWIQLSSILPWDRMVQIYQKKFSSTMGAKSINPRCVIGAFIIKHKLGLSDVETLQTISENPYMQFFLGQHNFNPKPLFSPTLFVDIRKKLGSETFDVFNQMLHELVKEQDSSPSTLATQSQAAEQPKPKGHLKIDATVADQYISYPTDLRLVNEVREKTEVMVDELFDLLRAEYPVKPRTYRRQAHKRYLAIAKQKKPSTSAKRMALRYLLNCVERNLGYINTMLDKRANRFALSAATQRELWIVTHLYQQHRHMYQTQTHQHDDQIVSISQPHVRPIVRGKAGKSVEFGAKLSLSLMDEILFEDKVSWDNFNESNRLQAQAETYQLLNGFYPELIQCDKIYHTNANRSFCKENNIRLTAAEKGPKKALKTYEKRKKRKEYNERNHIEGRIGNAKQALSLNEIKAKLKVTSEA